MDAAIFSTYPSSAYQFGSDTHKPCIGVIVARSCLSAKFTVLQYGIDITPQSCCGATPLSQSSPQHGLHEICRAIGNGLLLVQFGLIDDMSVSVQNLRHHDGHVILAVVHHCTITVDQFQQIYITTAQTQ